MEYFLYWYLIGFITFFVTGVISFARDGYVYLMDILKATILSCFGPLIPLLLIYVWTKENDIRLGKPKK